MNQPPSPPINSAPNPPEVQQLLSQLNDIESLQQVTWWPLAPGWWILGAVILAAVVGLSYLLVSRHKQKRYRKKALTELAAMQKQEGQAFLNSLSALLKRTAIKAYPHKKSLFIVAHGEEWPHILQRITPKAPLSQEGANALAYGLHQRSVNFDQHELIRFAKYWIAQHPRRFSDKTMPVVENQITKEAKHVSV